ncbi:PilN domain-containing protein [Marinagarivorans cellulosilyticus]|uniref:Type IV pilus assembly protein PilN n=1 Tax=Marinagarivorans cellulosilyticus TaxID=2721545 RepID=A0AAN1WEE1_9GAMM|nr:PilN domain-containing protein [Marinagarivorans cellulosilyticus]BCD96068.1 type IV pilus assembly protein PilN [Marinagarivorans cellulosilyticus]
MARINLLSWREEYRREKKQEFISHTVFVCILAGIAAFIWISMVNGAIDNQEYRNKLLKDELAVLNKQVKEIQELKRKREDLISRMRVIQDLQGTRPVIVRYFDEFVRAIPDGVFILSMVRKGRGITLDGVAESNSRVASLMRNIDNSTWFSESNLKSVTADPAYGEQAVRFSVVLNTVVPSGEDNKNK